jgi:saccharopine dehydrogenase (NADP+, L-glutamate forming)/spermidine synthase
VAGPLVRYFLGRPGTAVTVADMEIAKAKALVGAQGRGRAIALDLKDGDGLKKEIAGADIVVSLVPYTFHPTVARQCIALAKNMVTTSYAGEAMTALDSNARRAGIVILNEVGLDPGIDHMEAMRIIHGLKDRGGTILGFTSYCGGLPAPDAKTNPFGYKFSWSPRGVLLAGKNAARYLKDGREIRVPAEDLFDHYTMRTIRGLGDFEGYPNRDSFPYIELYGIPETRTMFRGTLRYPGWCETLKKIADLGLLDQTETDLRGMSHREFVARLIGRSGTPDLKAALVERLRLKPGSKVIDRLEWLGLLSGERLPFDRGSALDVLEALMLNKLQYGPGERDMIVLQHEFDAVDADGRREKIMSTLIDYGDPGGDSSMARTVGLPAAVGTRLILDGKIRRKGVCLPVHPEIYEPILEDLEAHGLSFKEERSAVA